MNLVTIWSHRIAYFALLLSFITPVVYGQGYPPVDFMCHTDEEDPKDRSTRAPLGDEIRALVVFVAFKNDIADYGNTWKLYPDSLWTPPSFIDDILDTSSNPQNFRPGTVSGILYHQSRNYNNTHLLYGDVYPKNINGNSIVYIPEHDNEYYHGVNVPLIGRTRGYGLLVKEILDNLTSGGLDLGHYVNNQDDMVDQIILVVRNDVGHCPGEDQCGVAGLGGSGVTQGFPLDGNGVLMRDLFYYSPSLNRQVQVDLRSWGSGHINWMWFNNTKMVVHEYGHHLFDPIQPGHTPTISSVDVPFNDHGGDTNFGYAVMIGGGNNSAGGFSAQERRYRGWLTEQTLAQNGTYTLPEFYDSGEAYEISLPNPSGVQNRKITIVNRQPDEPNWILLRTIRGGLFLEMTQNNPSHTQRRSYRALPADNNLFRWASPGVRAGNAFSPTGPQAKTQLTAWTRPNINGYNVYPGTFTPSFQAIDDIRYTGSVDSTMAFDYYTDFRTLSVVPIRADSWMGAETSGYTFTGEVHVKSGATLTLWQETDITFGGGLIIEAGAELIIEDGSQAEGTFTMLTDSRLIVRGEGQAQGAFTMLSGSRLIIEDGGRTEGTVSMLAGSRLIIEDGGELYLPPTQTTLGGSGAHFEIYGSGRIWAGNTDFSIVAYSMIAEGTSSNPVIFEPVGPGRPWRGLRLLEGQSTFDPITGWYYPYSLNYVEIRHADIGIDIRATGVFITNTKIEHNRIGLSTDYLSCLWKLCDPEPSIALLTNSLISNNEQYGLYLRNAHIGLVSSTVRNNNWTGIFAFNTDFTNFHANVILRNGYGTVGLGFPSGIHAAPNTSLLFNRQGDMIHDYPGLNRIEDNEDYQLHITSNAYVMIGEDGWGGGHNSILSSSPGCRILNYPGLLMAQNNYWGTTSSPSSSWFCGTSPVSAVPYLTSDPTSGSGTSLRPVNDTDGPGFIQASHEIGAQSRAGDGDPVTRLRDRIVAVRTALVEAPAAEDAVSWVRELAGLHRLDSTNETGEWEASRQVFLSLVESLSAPDQGSAHQRAAEEAAIILFQFELVSGNYDSADVWLAMYEPLVSDEAAFSLSWHAVALDEVQERFDSALVRLYNLIAGLGEEEGGLRAELTYMADVVARKQEEHQQTGRPAGPALLDIGDQATAGLDTGSLPLVVDLGSAYPNPTTGLMRLPLALPGDAHVTVGLYDMLGRSVSMPIERRYAAGYHSVQVDGSALAAGVYILRAEIAREGHASQVFTRRVTVVK